MASKTEICNLSLSHIGVGKEIADLDTEDSQEANACRRFYDIARDTVFRDYPWPFTTKMAMLGLVEENPTVEWRYSYSYPPDCLRARRILSGVRNDNRQSRVPYRIVKGDSGLLIYTDERDACLEYSAREEDVLRYPPDFINALSLRLAAYIAPRLTRGDQTGLGQRALELYLFEMARARASAHIEEQAEELPDSEFIRFRDGGDHSGRGQDFTDVF